MATAQDVQTTVGEIQALANEILGAVETFVPSATVPIEIAKAIEALAAKAIAAWIASSGTPVTVENLQTLLPDPTPLTPPTS